MSSPVDDVAVTRRWLLFTLPHTGVCARCLMKKRPCACSLFLRVNSVEKAAAAAATAATTAASSNLKDIEVFDEVFAFDRTVSRLMEMQSEEYLTSPWLGHATVDEVADYIVTHRHHSSH